MAIAQQDAASSLAAIERTQQRTSDALFYGTASTILLIWGVLTGIGYVTGQILGPVHALQAVWIAVEVAGVLGTMLVLMRDRRHLTLRQRLVQARFGGAMVVLILYGLVIVALLGPLSGRQISAFWPLLIMMAYVLAGFWVGRFFIIVGLAVSLLTIIGYRVAGDWYGLWMAAACGGGLILGGVWLRRLGARL